jgi:hypothetical protein
MQGRTQGRRPVWQKSSGELCSNWISEVVSPNQLCIGMAVRPVGAGARGCQTHWVRVWVSNRTHGCTHTRTHNKPGRGRVWISTRG